MERVQFQQEQMLAELKDLVQKGLFTQKEIKQIMKKRTAFETALVRKQPKKGDYLRYATYEMGLEALRKKRGERLKLPPGPPSVSDYALVRRQFQIFERAVKKFKSDVALWIQYIRVANKEGARSLVGRITARALQLHPNVPALYILAASHELTHLSPSAARALLQRGIRLNKDSVEMWTEYVKMEMGFVESLRRRWDVLGINVGNGKGKERSEDVVDDVEGEHMEVDAEEDDGEAAQNEIMQGAIVKSVITNAAKDLPKSDLFISLNKLISTYPCPASLRSSLLDHLHRVLQETLPHNPEAIKLTATRHLTSDTEGAELIDRLKEANEILIRAVKEATNEEERNGFGEVYSEFAKEWYEKTNDDNLKAYFIGSLRELIHQTSSTPIPSLLSTHLKLLAQFSTSGSPLANSVATPSKTIKLSRKYSYLIPESSRVWIATLEVTKKLDGNENAWKAVWKEARNSVRHTGVMDVWLWGLKTNDEPSDDDEGMIHVLQDLLKESLQMQESPSWKTIHENLLLKYVQTHLHSHSLAGGINMKTKNTISQEHEEETRLSRNLSCLRSVVYQLQNSYLPSAPLHLGKR
ncbi:UTP6 family protein [Abortiporus biennis]